MFIALSKVNEFVNGLAQGKFNLATGQLTGFPINISSNFLWRLKVPDCETGAESYNENRAYDALLPYDSPASTGYTNFWKLKSGK